MGHYNLITLDDLSTTSEVEGRTFVGGDLVSKNSATFATRLNKNSATDPTLVIVGDIAPGNPLNLNAGSLHLGGARNGRIINFNGGGFLVADPTLAALDMQGILETGSRNLANFTANNTATIPTGQPGPFRFTVADKKSTDTAIFHIDAADLFENRFVQQIELQPYRAETIVINVAGTTVDWDYGNMIGNLVNKNWRGNLIWNFYEATTINLNGHNFMGALLAPYADVTTSGNIDGSVAVKTLTTTAEVHQPEYMGNPTSACPAVTPTPTVTTTLTATSTSTVTPMPTATPTSTVAPMPTGTPTPTPVPLADLTVTKSSQPNPVVAGASLLYTITVTNHGPQSAENVIVTDQLPVGIIFHTATNGCTEQGGRVTCSLGLIPVGSSAIVTIDVDVDTTTADLN